MRIRQCRIMRGLAQHQLAARIGVTFQQAQKAIHRVAAAGRMKEALIQPIRVLAGR
jgi:transcriptional regulator with XRE-family HTH domain